MQNNPFNLDYLRMLFNDGDKDAFLKNFQRVADTFPSLVYVYDTAKKRPGYFNRKFSEILGYTEDDFSDEGIEWNSVIYKDDSEKFQQDLNKFFDLKDDENYTYETRLNRKAGDWRYFRTVGSVMRRSKDGKPDAFLFVAEDITEQLNSSEELKRTKELIIETEKIHRYGMYSYDMTNQSATWSDGMYEIFEVRKEEHPTINMEFYKQFVVDEDKHSIGDFLGSMQEDARDYELEINIKTAKDHLKILLDKGKIIKDDNGKISKCIGSVRDVTMDRMRERELEKTVKDLKHSNNELEEFAYVASHDMQEPLRKITTFSSRLSAKFGSALGEEGNTYLSRMNTAAKNMRILIENLLEISRTSRSEQPFEKTDLNEIIKGVESDLELTIEEHHAVIEIKERLPVFDAIPSQMRQLFNNLINNAIKFKSENKSPVITISARLIDKTERAVFLLAEKEYYEISVIDNGIGFEPEYADKVFQIFQRLHGKAEYPGSGIGLSICKKIMDKHKGIIYAKSEPAKGASFFMLLPAEQ